MNNKKILQTENYLQGFHILFLKKISSAMNAMLYITDQDMK